MIYTNFPHVDNLFDTFPQLINFLKMWISVDNFLYLFYIEIFDHFSLLIIKSK